VHYADDDNADDADDDDDDDDDDEYAYRCLTQWTRPFTDHCTFVHKRITFSPHLGV